MIVINKSAALLLALVLSPWNFGSDSVAFVDSATTAEDNDVRQILPKQSDAAGKYRRLKKEKGTSTKRVKGDKKDPHEDRYDVVVVGSGVSGMSAAYELEKAGKNVLVVEAMERIGGRMFGAEVAPNQYVDYGGQWLGRTQNRFRDLLEELDIGIFVAPSPLDGMVSRVLFQDTVYDIRGTVGLGFPLPEESVTAELVAQGLNATDITEAISAYYKFMLLADATIDTGGFPTDPSLREYDGMTFGEFIRDNVKSDWGKFILSNYPRIDGADGPSSADETSLLHKMWCAKNFPVAEEYNKYLLHGGAGQVPGKIEERLTHKVLTGNPVVAIDQTGDEAVVRTLTGKEIYAMDGVIVAMPPVMANRITFKPPLPASYHQLAQHMPMGTVAKVLISYSSPFWRDNGQNGFDQAEVESGNMCSFTADSSDPRSGKGVMIIFISAEHYDILNAIKGDEARKAAVLADLAVFLGEDALAPESFHIADWPAEPFIQGSYAGYMTPLGWTRFGESLVEKFGMVSWAGTETSDSWPGYFEGGIQAGIRAANEVMA